MKCKTNIFNDTIVDLLSIAMMISDDQWVTQLRWSQSRGVGSCCSLACYRPLIGPPVMPTSRPAAAYATALQAD